VKLVVFHINSFLYACCLLLIGCTYGYNIAVDTTPIANKVYPSTTDPIEVYYEDANLKFAKAYDQIAMIEVKGTSGSASSQLLYEMKEKAKYLGADAIINIKQHHVAREQGEILSELLNREESKPYIYDAISLTGIAIKYK
jgi:hypothetical protein